MINAGDGMHEHPSQALLDAYTILVALLALTALTAHGAAYITVKTPDPLSSRSRLTARYFIAITFLLSIPGTILTWIVQPQIRANFFAYPWGIIFPLVAIVGIIAMLYCNVKKRDLLSFFASCAFITGLLISSAFGVYPLVLPATDPAQSLTIQNASASAYGQTVGLIWWSIGIVLAISYFVFTYRLFWGKLSLTGSSEGY